MKFRLLSWVRFYPITAAIVAINIVVFVLQQLLANSFTMAGVFVPVLATPPFGFQLWRYFTSLFMHASLIHIFFNMFAFVSCGPIFERFFGWKKYLLIYLGSGVAGNLLYSLISTYFYNAPLIGTLTPYTVVLGASGCVFGLFGGLILIYKRLGANANTMILTVGVNLLLGWSLSGVAWQAHVGGLLGGLLFTKLAIERR